MRFTIVSNEYGIYLYKSSPALGLNRIPNIGISEAPPGPGYWPIHSTNSILSNHYGIYVNQSTANISGNNIRLHIDLGRGDGWGIYVVDSLSTRIYGNRMNKNMMSIYTVNSTVEIEWNLFWGIGVQKETYDLPYSGVEGVDSSLHIFDNTVDGLGFAWSTFIKLRNCNETTIIENNTISPNTEEHGWGVSVAMNLTSSSPRIINNKINGKEYIGGIHDWGDFGIKCYNNSNPWMNNNTVRGLKYIGMCIDSSSPILINNEIFGNRDGGIQIENLSSPIIDSNIIYDNINYGVNSTNSACIIVNNTIYSNIYAIYVNSSSKVNVINSTISNSTQYDFYLDTDSHATALNTTFNKSKVYFADTLSTLTVQWFLNVCVVNESFAPVPGASVWVNDTFGNEVTNSTTPPDGWIRWIRATEYVQNQKTINNHTIHNITVSNATLKGWAIPEPFMDRSKDVYVLLGTGKGYNLFLHEGWNFISLPYQPFNMSSTNILEVLKSIDGDWDRAQYYDAADPADPWKGYSPLKPPGLNDLNHINHTMGFWIHTLEPCTLFATGIPQASTNITLHAGWNMVGYPTDNAAVNISTAFSGISAYRDRPVEGYYEDAPYFTGSYAENYVMPPGQGYWVHVNANCTWTVDW